MEGIEKNNKPEAEEPEIEDENPFEIVVRTVDTGFPRGIVKTTAPRYNFNEDPAKVTDPRARLNKMISFRQSRYLQTDGQKMILEDAIARFEQYLAENPEKDRALQN